jgi:hypothetical protein
MENRTPQASLMHCATLPLMTAIIKMLGRNFHTGLLHGHTQFSDSDSHWHVDVIDRNT